MAIRSTQTKDKFILIYINISLFCHWTCSPVTIDLIIISRCPCKLTESKKILPFSIAYRCLFYTITSFWIHLYRSFKKENFILKRLPTPMKPQGVNNLIPANQRRENKSLSKQQNNRNPQTLLIDISQHRCSQSLN